MPMTAFQNGVSSFGIPVLPGGGGNDFSTGKQFFVNSNGGNDDGAAGTTPSAPFATVDFAVQFCLPNTGAIINVMPGHTELDTTSIELDIAGVWVRGLGWGDDRPRITFGSDTSTFEMSADNGRISNLTFAHASHQTPENAVRITGDRCSVESIETVGRDTTKHFTNLISIINADFARVIGCRLLAHDTGVSLTAAGIFLDGADDVLISGNFIYGHFTGGIDNVTGTPGDCQNCEISNNFVQNVAGGTNMVINMPMISTGFAANNRMFGQRAVLHENVDFGGLVSLENYLTDGDGFHGVVTPALAAS